MLGAQPCSYSRGSDGLSTLPTTHLIQVEGCQRPLHASRPRYGGAQRVPRLSLHLPARLTWCAAPRRPRSAARHWCRFFRVYCRGSLHRTTRWVRLRLRVARWRGPKKLKLKRLRAQKPADASTVTKFHARVPPSIAIRDYLERYARGAACGLQGRCRPPDGVGRAHGVGRAVAPPPRLTRARARARAWRVL